MSFLSSGASFLGREAAKQVMKSQEVLCHNYKKRTKDRFESLL